MARCLLVGAGCAGPGLIAELRARGHVVRATTRHPGRLGLLQDTGAEAVLADPDRLATFVPALDHVGFALLLLGRAHGPAEQLQALHGPRLEALLHRLIDTTVRGVVYEASGTVPAELLAAGAAAVTRLCAASRIPYEVVTPGPGGGWTGTVTGAVARLA